MSIRSQVSTKPHLRFIGDVHGKLGAYHDLAIQAEYSIQVGDVGFDYSYLVRKRLSPSQHKILGGNHDNYQMDEENNFCRQTPHFLGDYGIYEVPNFGKIFFLRGGKSIDQDTRVHGVNWWPEEELSWQQLRDAVALYKSTKPSYVVTHECPVSLIGRFKSYRGSELKPSRTALALEEIFLCDHKPKVYLHGHHHVRRDLIIHGTRFVCLEELGTLDFPAKST